MTTLAVEQQIGVDKTAIRAFHANVPEAELTELRHVTTSEPLALHA